MVAATVDVSVGAQEIRTALESDGELFIETLLAEHLESPVPKAHVEIWQLLTNTALSQILLAIPRGHAKTTLAKLCVVWYYVYTDHRFCLYVSNTNGIALNSCKDIVDYILSDNFAAIYGPAKIITSNTTHSLWVFELTDAKGRKKRCVLRALGANQQVRGINLDNKRPDIIVVDDLEDLDNTRTEDLQRNLDLWVFGPFIKAFAKEHKIIWLGNMIRETCLLARLAEDPDWNPVVFGSLIKDKETGEIVPLWPYLWSVEALVKDYQKYRKLGLQATWLCEMMNMPGHLADGYGPESLNYAPVPTPDDVIAAFLILDPAFGEETQHDESAITVHVIPRNGPPMVVECEHGKWDEATVFAHMFRLANKWNAWTWGIESIAAQRVLISLFRLMLAPYHMQERVQFIPLISGSASPKAGRIKAWASLMAAEPPAYAIPEGDIDIGAQLLKYDVRSTDNQDDIVDSCAYGPIMIDQYRHLIEAHYLQVWEAQAGAQFGRSIVDV